MLRRLDYALEATKDKVLETERTLKEKGLENRHGQLCRAAGYAFYNTSKFTYESLLHDDANLALNLRQYLMGFSPNVREIFAAFNFDDSIRDLDRVNLLYLLMERFNEKSKVEAHSMSAAWVGPSKTPCRTGKFAGFPCASLISGTLFGQQNPPRLDARAFLKPAGHSFSPIAWGKFMKG